MPAVCRVGDRDVTHCSGMVRAQGSPNVFVNGISVSNQGHFNTGHLKTGIPCLPHKAAITTGSSSVFCNLRGMGRVNDPIAGCTRVAAGSSNVFCGG